MIVLSQPSLLYAAPSGVEPGYQCIIAFLCAVKKNVFADFTQFGWWLAA